MYAVLGDTGRGSEGRANAGFVVTEAGVVAIDAGGSPRDGERLVSAIRLVTRRPIRWLVLTHHHPDHDFGAVAFRRAGAQVVAHPDRRTLAGQAGDSVLVADWTRVVGRDAMRGFAFADAPDRPVTGGDTLRLGARRIVVVHPGAAHTPGDLAVWIPDAGVLFAGDLLVEDGVTMMVDGSSAALLRALAWIDSLAPHAIVPGHGAPPRDPAALVRRTREYVLDLRARMRDAVDRGLSLSRALAPFPPADSARPVSLASRRRRNAVRAYLEEERRAAGFDPDSTP